LTQNPGNTVNVNPGATGESEAYCFRSHPYLVGGGYDAHGADRLSVASVVANFLNVGPAGVHWLVRVANPAGAGGPVSFTPLALCMSIQMATVTAG
jgi:hypothetical protein